MGTNIIFYDGTCALCHGFVTFVLNRDVRTQFSFTPLQGEEIKKHFKPEVIKSFPDSVIVYTKYGDIYKKSSAVVFVLQELGYGWRVLGFLLWIIPQFLRDIGYDIVAAFRKRIFGSKENLCPIIPDDIKSRFLI